MLSTITITDEDCKIILNNSEYKEHQYSGKELLPFTEGRSGVLGEHYKLKIKLKETPEVVKCFVKRVSKFNKKEEGFYGKIVPKLFEYQIESTKEVLPKCYYIKNSEYIVLEDLNRCGFFSINTKSLLNVTQVDHLLSSLAKYHAASITYEIKKGKELDKDFQLCEEFPDELKEVYYRNFPDGKDVLLSIKNTIASQINLFEDIVCKSAPKDKLITSLEQLWDSIKDYAKPSQQYKNVMCHGDLWQSNLMYSTSKSQFAIIDQQMIRYCPPALDVMGFIYLTTDKELRNNHLNTLLKKYYCYLRNELQKYQIYLDVLIPEEEFLKSCEHYKLFAIMQAFSYAQITYIPCQLFEKIMGGDDGKTKFLFESRASVVKNLCEEEPEYKKRQLDVLIDFVEYAEKNI
ncbi:uncharacterized protein [Onthophagus taurus]|uniref:uncharacterized protein n=1 Tax=Onthophagus taurus TaxID=166361 RepID=UPI0039BDDDFE